MLSKRMNDALNGQTNHELYSSYLYLSMAAYFEEADLPGFANWVYVQAKEELTHAEKFFRYTADREGRVLLDAVGKPPAEWASPEVIFTEVLAHERKISAHIGELVELALVEKDHATHHFLQWFVGEQVEEEASAKEVLQRVKLVASAPGGLFLLDRELALRVFTPPAATA